MDHQRRNLQAPESVSTRAAHDHRGEPATHAFGVVAAVVALCRELSDGSKVPVPLHAQISELFAAAMYPSRSASACASGAVTASSVGSPKAVAGDDDVDVAGGTSTVRQTLAAGAIDELVLDIVPVWLGTGERLFDEVEDPGLHPIEVIHSSYATHVR